MINIQQREVIQMIMKHSRQRAAIEAFLKTRKDHPTADVVYQHVRQEFPNISLGTVYRNLTQLSDAGMISRLHFNEINTDCFDATTASHQHFVCSGCHAVSDIEMGDMSYVKDEAAKCFNGRIDSCNIYFTGLCSNCLTKTE